MIIKLQIPLFLLLMTSTISFSKSIKDKDNKVTIEQLKEKSYPNDLEAKAVILDESVKMDYQYSQNDGFTIQTKIYRKIKIYHKDALRWGTHVERLHKNLSYDEKLIAIKGKTYNLIDGKINIEKLSKEGVFLGNVSESENTMKLVFPKVKEGCIIEYSYTKVSPFYTYIDPIFFEKEIPVKKIDVEINIPEYYNYNIQTRGSFPIKVVKSSKAGKIQYLNRNESRAAGFSTSRTTFNTTNIDYNINTYVVHQTNIPALVREPFVPNVWNYASTLEFYLNSIKYPYSPVKNYAYSWDDTLKKTLSSSNFDGEVSKSDYYKKDLEGILANITDEKEKSIKIFEYVKKSIKWNSVRTSRPYKGVKKAYKSGVGSSGQINAILLSMLQHADIKARPVFVISDKKRKSIFPNYNAFDYLIVEVMYSDNSKVYMDATAKKSIPNVLPTRVIQGLGKLMSDSGKAIDIDLRPKPSKVQTILSYKIDDLGSATGKFKVKRVENAAYDRRHYLKKDDKKNIIELKKKSNFSEITDYSNNVADGIYKGLSESYSFNSEEAATVVDDEIYLHPMLFLRKSTNPLKQEVRKLPIDWGYTEAKSYMIMITIPDGYKVVSIPEKASFVLPNKGGAYSFQSIIKGQTISFRIKEKLNEAFFTVGEASNNLKEFYKIIVEKENEQIVLKKI